MPASNRSKLSTSIQLYILLVCCLGLTAFSLSVIDLLGRPLDWHRHWFMLAVLTFISGWLSVKLPSSFNATISISETFVFAGTLIFGPSVGTVLVALDAVILCTKEQFVWRRLRWQQVVFNITQAPLSIWASARAAGIHGPLGADQTTLSVGIVLQLALFAALYFLLNSWLVTVAVALQQRMPPLKVWWTNFRETSVNFAAGASIAAFLVNTREVNGIFIGVVVPPLFVIYLTYQWSRKRVEAERLKIQELNRVFLSTIEALAFAIDAKDQVTHGHIRRVQRYTMALADALGVKEERQLDAIRAAALLHDTGKLAVPEYILNKPGPLTASEFERMKVHADVGADILKSINFPYPVEPIVRHHHESWDGSGYPAGLRAQQIPLGARILSVVDCYDALTSDRPYRPRYTRQQAEQVLRERRGTMYDPWVVDGFLRILDDLEQTDALERDNAINAGVTVNPWLIPAQLDVISATTAEEREFNELRRDLPKAPTLEAAVDVFFRHLRRVIPAASQALYIPTQNASELRVAACAGTGTAIIDSIKIPIGDRISGWAFAHKEAVVNSDATLELGPVARTLAVPLRYAMAVPLADRNAIGVVTLYSHDPFNKDHRRLLEAAATLFVSSLALPSTKKDSSPAEPASPAGDDKHPIVPDGTDTANPKSRIH